MIIISQDKEKIVNFDNISFIEVEDDLNVTEHRMYEIIAITNSMERTILGEYETLERVKEVLDDIVWEYKKNDYISYFHFPKKNIFEMPLK